MMSQLASSVSTTNAKIGKSIIVDSIKEHKKKKRNKNRKVCKKRQDTCSEERESSTQENMLWTENRRNFPLSGLNLYHREASKYQYTRHIAPKFVFSLI